jgi:CubicO group peptidase (beta-lactamase class C family)
MFDPTLKHLTHRELIEEVLETHLLQFEPGTKYAYSNFGFCLLGRVIEKVTGQPYAEYVRQQILAPCGITAMRIAGNTLAARVPHEVRYVGLAGQRDPYGLNVARMDSHGGWLGSAADLVRFCMHATGIAGDRSLLKPATIHVMTTPTPLNPAYARGWRVNPRNWWHTGTLTGGTMGLMVRTGSGFCWAGLLNKRSPRPRVRTGLDRLLWRMARTVKAWHV